MLLSLALMKMSAFRLVAIGGKVTSIVQFVILAVIATLTPRNVAFTGSPVLIWQAWIGVAWLRADE